MKDGNPPESSARKRNIALIIRAASAVLLCGLYFFIVIYPTYKANKEYAEQLAGSWVCMESSILEPGDTAITAGWSVHRSTESPSVLERLRFNAARLSNSIARSVRASADINNDYERTAQVTFYGTTCTFHYPTQRLALYGLSDDDLSTKWLELSGGRYDNLLYDCLSIKEQMQLCDWAYLQLLNQISEKICGIGNEAIFLQAYLYAQSGYKMRFATSADYRSLFMSVAAYPYLISRTFFRMDDGNYYLFPDPEGSSLYISMASFSRGDKYMSLAITTHQRFAEKPVKSQKKIIIDNQEVELYVNENLLNFYKDYPKGYYDYDDDFCRLYAEPAMDDDVRRQVYPYLRQAITGKSETEAVGYLLNWIQTQFDYKTDEEVWGYERAFFPVETLFYPYSDCEDRSILFSRLIKDLVGSDVILLLVPEHMTAAVHFKQDESLHGTYLELEGKKYYVCDPSITGTGAPIGTDMKRMRNQPVRSVKIN